MTNHGRKRGRAEKEAGQKVRRVSQRFKADLPAVPILDNPVEDVGIDLAGKI
jgi:hypothetical protein